MSTVESQYVEHDRTRDVYELMLPSGEAVCLPGYIVRDFMGIPITELVKMLSEKAVYEYLRFRVSYGLRGKYVSGCMMLLKARLEGYV